MKKNSFITILLIVAALPYLFADEVVDRIVAKVGREIILQSELNNHMKQIMQMGITGEDITELELLRDIVESKLIFQAARDRNYQVDEFRIRQLVDNQINTQISQLGSESALRTELAKYDMTISDLRNYFEQMIREQRLKEIIISNEIKSRIQVTEVEIEDYYHDNLSDLPLRPEMVEIGMIMKRIEPSERTRRNILKEINRIYDRIREGKDFGELAKEYSDCPSRALNGDLGFFGRGTMIKAFEDVAFSLKPGEISNIVETNFGYHIIKMEDKDGDEIRVKHILKMVVPSETDVKETEETMQLVLQKARTGEDFTALAKEYSDDPSAQKRGIIGEFTDDSYPEMFKNYLVNIEVGEFTDLIREDEYIYLFGKLRRIEERDFELEEIRDELREYLITMKQADHYERWINNLIENSYVEFLLD